MFATCAGEIVKSDIDAVTEPVLDAVVYQMTDLMGSGKYGQALQKLHLRLSVKTRCLLFSAYAGHAFRR